MAPHVEPRWSRRGFLAAGLAVAGALVAPGVAAFTSGGSSKVVRVGDTVDAKNPEVLSEEFFVRRLAELTGNRFSGHAYPNSVLGSHSTMNEQLRNGTLELAKSNSADLAVYEPGMGIFGMPFAFTERAQLFAAEDGVLGRRLAAGLERQGIVLLGWFDSGQRNVYNTVRPLREPADLRGLKIRVIDNQVMIDTFNTLGAQATPVETSQIYSALQQGVVNAAENSFTFYVQQHHNEIAKFYSLTEHFFSVDPLLASKRWLDALSSSDRDAVRHAAHDAQEHERSLWLNSDTTYRRLAEQTGTTVNEADIPAFTRAVRGVYDRNRASFGPLLDLIHVE